MPAGNKNDNKYGIDPQHAVELDYPTIAEWCALEGLNTIIFNFRGTGQSGGNFHPLGWAEDLEAILDFLIKQEYVKKDSIAVFGSSMGAAIAIYVAARRKEIAGVVSFASPAIMNRRANPELAIERFRDMGIIKDANFPESIEQWADESRVLNPVEWIAKISPRPILLIHGDADEVVSPGSLEILYREAGYPKDMKMLEGIGHRLRSEPDALKFAIEWLTYKFVSTM
jgi:fermentation-respiration switch protein FrsA (DUF1100 family)